MTYVDRETVCQKGKFRLEEWEDVNYCEHCFYNDDEPLEDEDVVLLLAKVTKENEQLKQDKKRLIGFLHRYKDVDVEEIDEVVLSKEYLDEWGELYYSEW